MDHTLAPSYPGTVVLELGEDAGALIVYTGSGQHGREIEDAYLDWCVRVAEGNPYFLQELANHWVETGDQKADVIANTARYVQVLEAIIRRHPEQWLWIHRRFRTRPATRPRS